MADDFAHADFVRKQLQNHSPLPWWDMFHTSSERLQEAVYLGLTPWWTSSRLHVRFFRPIAVATHFIDHSLWPNLPELMHLENVLIYGGLCVVVRLFYRRLFGPSWVATLAACLYAVDDAHVDAVDWIASRNTLLTALFGAAACLAFDRNLSSGRTRYAWLCALALGLASFSSEGALAVWAYLLGQALFLDRRPAAMRALSLAPALAVTLVWVGATAYLDCGARGTGSYVDPRSEPMEFLRLLPQRVPTVLNMQFGVPESMLHATLPVAAGWLQVVSYAVWIALFALALPKLWQKPSTRALLVGSLGSAVTICTTVPQTRVLFIVGFGCHGLLAEMIGTIWRGLWQQVPVSAGSSSAAHWMRGIVLAAVLLFHAVAAPWASLWLRGDVFYAHVRDAAATIPNGPGIEDRVIVLANTPSYSLAFLVAAYRMMMVWPAPRRIYIAGASANPVLLSRPAADSVRLEPEGGYLLEPSSHWMRKPSEPFIAGQVFPLDGLAIQVERTTSDGRPAIIRLALARGYEQRILWMTWSEAAMRFIPFELPRVGEWLPLLSRGR